MTIVVMMDYGSVTSQPCRLRYIEAGFMFVFLSSSELRRESRRLENEVDLKLVSFSKLGSTYSHRDARCDTPSVCTEMYMYIYNRIRKCCAIHS